MLIFVFVQVKSVSFGHTRPGGGTGRDFAGQVVAVGEQVTHVSVGDRVCVE